MGFWNDLFGGTRCAVCGNDATPIKRGSGRPKVFLITDDARVRVLFKCMNCGKRICSKCGRGAGASLSVGSCPRCGGHLGACDE